MKLPIQPPDHPTFIKGMNFNESYPEYCCKTDVIAAITPIKEKKAC